MANQALAVLESALRDRKLDRTLTTALLPLDRADTAARVPFGIAALDGRLRGGVPRGQLSELAGSAGQGRMTLLLQLLAAATSRGEIAAFVDTCDRLDVASAAAAGVCLDRLLWIRGDAVASGADGASGGRRTAASGGAAGAIWERTLDRAIKALNLVLQAGGFTVVAIDLADVPPVWLKRLPFTTWLRVQRSIEGSDTACVLVTPEPLARSAGGLTLTLSGRTTWNDLADPPGRSARSRRLTGMAAQVRIISPRRRVEGAVDVRATVGVL